MKINVLAFGVHPDDVELGCGGTLLVEKQNGKTTGIIDLTAGELGTRGTAQTRAQEAKQAAEILQVNVRENLELEDGFFENNKTNLLKVISVIRKYQPDIVLCNAPEDRHPDHGRSSQLVSDASFLAGLSKIETIDEVTKKQQERWRPAYVFHYIQDRYLNPHFVFDISSVVQTKIEAIKAYQTQFYQGDNNNAANAEPQTYISKPEFLNSVINRWAEYGKMVGVAYAEGYISKKMVGISNFNTIIQNET